MNIDFQKLHEALLYEEATRRDMTDATERWQQANDGIDVHIRFPSAAGEPYARQGSKVFHALVEAGWLETAKLLAEHCKQHGGRDMWNTRLALLDALTSKKD